MSKESFDPGRRNFLRQGLAGMAIAALPPILTACARDRGRKRHVPEVRETAVTSSKLLIVQTADAADGAHYRNNRIVAINPATGAEVLELARGSAEAYISPTGKFVATLNIVDDLYEGNNTPASSTVRVTDLRQTRGTTVMQQTDAAFSPGGITVNDNGDVIVMDPHEERVMKYAVSNSSNAEMTELYPQGNLTFTNNPRPKCLPETSEVSYCFQEAEGPTIFIYDSSKPKSMPRGIPIHDSPRQYRDIVWFANMGALSTVDRQHKPQVVLFSLEKPGVIHVNDGTTNPRFSEKGLLAVEIAQQFGQPLGVDIIDTANNRLTRLEGLRDPLWVDDYTVLVRKNDGSMHAANLNADLTLKGTTSLGYRIPVSELTTLVGLT